MRRKGILSLVLFLHVVLITLFPAFLFAQTADNPVVVKASANNTKVKIGDHIEFTLEAKTDINISLIWPEFNDSITEKIKALNAETIDTSKINATTIKYTQHHTLSIYDSGSYTLPPILFNFINENDTFLQTAITEPIEFEVAAPIVDLAKDIKDIAGNRINPYTFKEVLPWLIALLLIVVAIYFWFRYKRYLKDKPVKTTTYQAPLRPAHVIALEELALLSDKKLIQKSLIKQYYTELTEIIRVYFEHRFMIQALEMTTNEILKAVNNNAQWESSLSDRLNYMLEMADMVKFAKSLPKEEDSIICLKDAYLIVNETADTEQKVEDHSDSGEEDNL